MAPLERFRKAVLTLDAVSVFLMLPACLGDGNTRQVLASVFLSVSQENYGSSLPALAFYLRCPWRTKKKVTRTKIEGECDIQCNVI